jgi:hypothetical protein
MIAAAAVVVVVVVLIVISTDGDAESNVSQIVIIH